MPTVRGTGKGYSIIDPPYVRIRVRSWAVDDTGDEPKLVYVYSEGQTQERPADKWLSVDWDDGGMSRIRNDYRVTWLDEGE